MRVLSPVEKVKSFHLFSYKFNEFDVEPSFIIREAISGEGDNYGMKYVYYACVLYSLCPKETKEFLDNDVLDKAQFVFLSHPHSYEYIKYRIDRKLNKFDPKKFTWVNDIARA